MSSASLIQVGEYLGRPVLLASDESVKIPPQTASVAAILVYDFHRREGGKAPMLVEALADQTPVAICVAGDESEHAFDSLLRTLSKPEFPRRPHVMTAQYTGSFCEAVEEFLLAALPMEERFAEWDCYIVWRLSGHAPDDVRKVSGVLKGLLRPDDSHGGAA